MKRILGVVVLYAVVMLFCTRSSNGNCICPDHKTWVYPVKHHEFCGKELSGNGCQANARYNCTEGNPKAVFWDFCKDKYKDPYCSPQLAENCDYEATSTQIRCMTQRTCFNKVTADKTMMKIYGKKTLLPQEA